MEAITRTRWVRLFEPGAWTDPARFKDFEEIRSWDINELWSG
jgi:hypothetical protein